MSISSNSKPTCPGSECQSETLASLSWQTLTSRFDSEVMVADFGIWVDNDLAVMESRLNQFTAKSSARRSR